MNELILISYLVLFVALIFGSLTDLKKREVPDTLNYGLVVFGLSLRIVASYYYSDWTVFLEGLLGFGVFFGLGAAMFYSGQWGGGDAKLLFGMGAILGLPLELPMSLELPFMLSFVINLLLVGAVYGLFWSAALAIKNRKEFFEKTDEIFSDPEVRRYKYFMLAFAVLVLLAGRFLPKPARPMMFVIAVIVVGSFYLFYLVRAVEQVCMYRTVETKNLVEGDWVAEDVIVNKKVFVKKGVITKKHLEKIGSVAKMNAVHCHVSRKMWGITKELHIPVFKLKEGDSLQKNLKVHKLTLKKGTKLTEKHLESIAREIYKNQFSRAQIIPQKQSFFTVYKEFDEFSVQEGDELLEDVYLGERLCGPTDLGIDREQIDLLQKRKIRSVLVKEGIPFVPSFLFAFLVTACTGGKYLLLYFL